MPGSIALAAGHHYLSPPYQSLQSVPLLSRLAADTGSMDLCLSVLLLALLNPVQVAEDIASLDIMSEGRVVFGIGIGYREVEYEGFGMTRQERVPRMLEALELIKRLWTEEVVTHEGRFFRVHDATCTIRPVQKPYPPIWIAANADQAVVRTARHGAALVYQPACRAADDRAAVAALQAGARRGQPADAGARPIALELHVAATREQAVDDRAAVSDGEIQRLCRMGAGQGVAGRGKLPRPFDESGPRPLCPRHARTRRSRQIEERISRLESELPDFPARLARHGGGARSGASSS